MTLALREAHAHLAMLGREMSLIPLSRCRSGSDLLRAVARAHAEDPRPWLVGVGMRTEAWEQRALPALADLDAAAGGRPCFLWSFDHHAAMASSSALRRAGIDPRSPGPDAPGGRIVRDARGHATGLLIEHAAKRVWSSAPEPTVQERREQVLAALAHLHGLGFVEVHDLLAPRWLGPLLADLHGRGDAPAAVTVYVPLDELEPAAAEARGPGGWERPGLRLGGAKLFADGTLNSRTAWMLHPYADPLPDMPRGQAMQTPAQLDEAIARVARLGLGLAVHAIGDAAVRAVLDAWERWLDGSGVARPSGAGLHSPAPEGRATQERVTQERATQGTHLRIEHAEIIDEADVPRFARLGVVCSVQPCHLLADVEALRRGLPHRLDRVLPLRELIDSGCRPGRGLVFGSDVPIVGAEPRDSIQAAVHRSRPGDPQPIAPGQAISVAQAWAAFAAE